MAVDVVNIPSNNTEVAASRVSNFIPAFSISDLFSSRVHYGHRTRFKNPKMSPFVHSEMDGISIIDLAKTKYHLSVALEELYKVSRKNGRIVFVGTKLTISKLVKKYALSCGQYHVHNKWVGGTITNWETISNLLKKLDNLEKIIKNDSEKYTKKEIMKMAKHVQKLEREVGGLRGMRGRPDIVFVIDVRKERMAIKEASDVGIRTIGIVDTDSSPDSVTFAVPGNDDSTKSAELYLKLASEAVLHGIRDSMKEAGIEFGGARKTDQQRQPKKLAPKDQ